jgi:N,N-dimethylformamidase
VRQPATEDLFAARNRLLSLYDRHADGTGVTTVSLLRPQVTMRPGLLMPVAGAPHGLGADLYLVDWLEQRGTPYEVAADEDLDADGVALLAPYRVVLTGTHPEYWTEATLDAAAEYLDGGGRLMYLGGNGFYWVTSLAADEPHVLEVRRGPAGTGPFRGQPGEVHHSTTGEPGGLWRFRGRPPHALTGVGFTAMGHVGGRPYVPVTPVDPRASFVLEGLDPANPIGGPALHVGGPAAVEVDRLDPALGSPANTVVVATASDFPPGYLPAGEDVTTAGDMEPRALVRADLVYLEHETGGAVFSVGSIGWCAALSADGYTGAVSRITGNVLDRFLADPCDG